MKLQTVAGPFKIKSEAQNTATCLGNQAGIYSIYIKDADGFNTENLEWYVERDLTIAPCKLFGYPTEEFLRKQYK